MNFSTYDHHHAAKAVSAICVDSVTQLIEDLRIPKKNQTTKFVREAILGQLHTSGWSDEAKLDAGSSITITSVKELTGLCFQTGNMARLYADLLKLQLLFSRKKINGALFLVFSKKTATTLGENVANFDRLTKELDIFRDVITVPTLVFGIEVVES